MSQVSSIAGRDSQTTISSSAKRSRSIFPRIGVGMGLRRRPKPQESHPESPVIVDKNSNDVNNHDIGDGGGDGNKLQRIDSGDSLVVPPSQEAHPPLSSPSGTIQAAEATSPLSYTMPSKASGGRSSNGNEGFGARIGSIFSTRSSGNSIHSNRSAYSNRSNNGRQRRPPSNTPREVLLHNSQLYHSDVDPSSMNDTSIEHFRRGMPRKRMLLYGLKQEQSTRHLRPSFFSQLGLFKRLSDWAFDVVDVDCSGHIDENELYAGILLIHLQLGQYAGIAACKVCDFV